MASMMPWLHEQGQAADSRRPNEGVALFLRNYDEYFGYATQ